MKRAGKRRGVIASDDGAEYVSDDGVMLSIGSNFVIPAGYRKVFIFGEKRGGFRHILVFDEHGIRTISDGEPESALVQSRCLDWVQETIERVRKEVGG